jgi:outer membrane receptor protein involved in Fe transport
VRGAETSVIWRVLQPLTLQGSASWNSSRNIKNAAFTNPATGQPIPLNPNPFGELGSPLALSPPFQANLRARYEWRMGNYDVFGQVGMQHQAHSHATTNPLSVTLQGVPTNFDDPGFTTYSASVGVAAGKWTVQLYGENLTDVRAILDASYLEYVKMNTINRPRTMGLKFSYNFSEAP